MRRWYIRRKLKRLIAYHERMRNIFIYICRQQSIGYHPDKMINGCDLWIQQGYHFRYADRVRKILNNYQ